MIPPQLRLTIGVRERCTSDQQHPLPALFSQLEIDVLMSKACIHNQTLSQFLRTELGLPQPDESEPYIAGDALASVDEVPLAKRQSE